MNTPLKISTLAWSLAFAASAQAQSLDLDDATDGANEMDTQIAEMRNDLNVVARGYGEPLPVEVGRVNRRLREGEIHFLLNDYLRASIVLLDVVEDERHRSHPKYDEAVFLLAESLRKSKNYTGARRYYEDILPKASGDRLKDIVLGLLEIAAATERYDDVDRYISRLRQAGTLSRPDVDYIYAKMLFRGGGSDPSAVQRAYDTFKKIPSGNAISAAAAYYAGVSLVKLGRYEDAIQQFKDVFGKVSTSPQSQTLKELTSLSLGRLYQEIGDVASSADAYQEISQKSAYFPDMLFEVAWAHTNAARTVKDPEEQKKGFNRALRATELLMATSPRSRLYPEARILQGNLQIRLGAPETAYDTFQTVIDRYGGARDKLVQMRSASADPRAFFDELLRADLEEVGGTGILPPLAITWARDEADMERALAMEKDLNDSEQFIKDSEELVETLNEALDGEQRFAMFPGLGSARSKAISIENRMINSSTRLLTMERQVLWPFINEQQRASVQAAHQRAKQLEGGIEALPQTAQDVELSKDQIKADYQQAEQRVYKLSFRVNSMRSQAVAVEIWLNQNRTKLSPEEIELTEQRIQDAKREVDELQVLLEALQADIRKATVIAGSDAGRSRSLKLRADFANATAAEAQLLRTLRTQAPPEYQGLLQRFDQQRAAIDKIDSDLKKLQLTLDQQIRQRVDEIRKGIALEVNRLREYKTEHVALQGETGQMLGPVAAKTLDAVGKQFRELVLKADVGIIDVAWARKQVETQKVNKLIKEQQARTQELEAEFADVLKE